MASTRGRGYVRGTSNSPNAQALRRPGEAGLIQRLENLTSSMSIKVILFYDLTPSPPNFQVTIYILRYKLFIWISFL